MTTLPTRTLDPVPTPAGGDDLLVDAWREMLDRHARISCSLERSLAEFSLGVSEFEVLDHLVTSETGCLRIQELADAVHLSQSALSRVVGRLEADGLVSRSHCDSDRRGVYAGLTDAGRDRHAVALPTHRQVLREGLAPRP